jgi:hypothetical protein
VFSIDAGAFVIILLDALAGLANDTAIGAGTLGAFVTSQSAFINTPFPIVQSGIGTLVTLIFSFAQFVGYQGLNPGPWAGAPPTNVEDATNRMAALLQTLNGGVPIPRSSPFHSRHSRRSRAMVRAEGRHARRSRRRVRSPIRWVPTVRQADHRLRPIQTPPSASGYILSCSIA